jgi:hypothetical protein
MEIIKVKFRGKHNFALRVIIDHPVMWGDPGAES